MTSKELPSPELLRQILSYHPGTGKLFWISRPESMFVDEAHSRSWNTQFSGKEAFVTLRSDGYRQGRICGPLFPAHRVAWVLYHGECIEPGMQIDHVNLDRSDNRIANLRIANRSENAGNTTKRKTNSSGHKGVVWHKRAEKWEARIQIRWKTIYLGLFDNLEDAAAAYIDASKLHHGEFSRA